MTDSLETQKIRPTLNRMGCGSTFPHEINLEFVNFAGTCQLPVLDIGCGYGVAALAALQKGAHVIANDLESSHLECFRATVPSTLQGRLQILPGSFPFDLHFRDVGLGAIHACNVLLFLAPSELEIAISRAFRWLAPGGKIFVMTATPYQACYERFIPVFEEKKAAGVHWPGWIENLTQYSSHPVLQHFPNSLNLFDADVLSSAFSAEGFEVETAREYSRTGLPECFRYDGRENVMLIARKPA